MTKKPKPIRRADGAELRVPVKDFKVERVRDPTDAFLSPEEIKALEKQGEEFLRQEYSRRSKSKGLYETIMEATVEKYTTPPFDETRPHERIIPQGREQTPAEFMIEAQIKRAEELQEFVDNDPGHQEVFKALDKVREYQKTVRDNQRDNVDKHTIPGVRAQKSKEKATAYEQQGQLIPSEIEQLKKPR